MKIDVMKQNILTRKKKAKGWQYDVETITDADYVNDLALRAKNLPKVNQCCIACVKQTEIN